jgi:hypothetical protein
MSHDDWSDEWMNPGGPDAEPDASDSSWLVPVTGWEWDADSLRMGEYVGYPLYLSVRDRLQHLRVPANCHNRLIQQMIDMHDVSAFELGEARSTLIMWDVDANMMPMAIVDASRFAPLSATGGEGSD